MFLLVLTFALNICASSLYYYFSFFYNFTFCSRFLHLIFHNFFLLCHLSSSTSSLYSFFCVHYYKFGFSWRTQIWISWSWPTIKKKKLYNIYLEDHVHQEKFLYFVEEIWKNIFKKCVFFISLMDKIPLILLIIHKCQENYFSDNIHQE